MVAIVLLDLVANVLVDLARGFANPTCQQDCMESSCSQCVEEIGAVVRFRQFRVTEKTRCWQTKPSGQQKQSCENFETKLKDSTVKVKS